jgi:hypothetical protein
MTGTRFARGAQLALAFILCAGMALAAKLPPYGHKDFYPSAERPIGRGIEVLRPVRHHFSGVKVEADGEQAGHERATDVPVHLRSRMVDAHERLRPYFCSFRKS